MQAEGVRDVLGRAGRPADGGPGRGAVDAHAARLVRAGRAAQRTRARRGASWTPARRWWRWLAGGAGGAPPHRRARPLSNMYAAATSECGGGGQLQHDRGGRRRVRPLAPADVGHHGRHQSPVKDLQRRRA
jgi:hypothetical protein